jgi:hypothetical protein
MSTGDHGRSRLVLGAAALLLLALAIAAGSFALAADAKQGWTKCADSTMVKNISCTKAKNKVTKPYYDALNNRPSPIEWGRGCDEMDNTGNVCHFKVNGFKCTATTWNGVTEVTCTKEKKKQKVRWAHG